MRMFELRKTLKFVFLVSSLGLPLIAAGQKDIQCGKTHARYEQPGECANSCKGQIDAERCMIQPQLKALNDQFFEGFYNNSLFWAGSYLKAATCGNDPCKDFNVSLGTNAAPSLPAMLMPLGIAPNMGGAKFATRDKLVERIFGAWLHPNNYPDFIVNWTDPNPNGSWANLDLTPDKNGKYVLNIAIDSLCRSPAAFIVAIAHEMIHMEQHQRSYRTVGRDDFGMIRAAFMEDEAYSWELRTSNFAWKMATIRSNPFMAGETSAEIKESKVAQQCYEWQTESLIEKLRTSGFGSTGNMINLGRFMSEDPWVSTQWLPSHTNWKTTMKAGPAPAVCQAMLADEPNQNPDSRKTPNNPCAKTAKK